MTKHKTDEEFNNDVTNIYNGTDPTSFPDLGIVVAERNKLTAPFEDWVPKYAAGGEIPAGDNRSKNQIAYKTRARIVLEPVVNHFVKVNIKNNVLISDETKILWNVHIDSGTRHRIGEGPSEFPVVVETDKNTPLHIKLRQKANTSTGSFAHPSDVSRCDAFVYIYYNPGTPPVPTPDPTSAGQFIKTAESTDDWIDIAFTLAEKGLRVKILLEYFNAKGNGASSEIIDTFVP